MRWLRSACLFIVPLVSTIASGEPVSLPERWLDRVVPEKSGEVKYPEYFNALDKARQQVSAGLYKQALSTLAAEDAKGDPVKVALVKADALAALGRYELAAQTLDEPKVAGDLSIQLRKVRLLTQMDRWHDAAPLAKKLVEQSPNSIQARYLLGEVAEHIGDLETAKASFKWFVEEPQSFLVKWQGGRQDVFPDADTTTTVGRAIDRWAQLTGAYKDNTSLHNTILDFFVKSYDILDRGNVGAHLAAAEYFLTHDDLDEARGELSAVLESNSKHLEALKLMAEILISRRQADPAEALIESIREVNPDSLDAAVLELRSLVLRKFYTEAIRVGRELQKRSPKNVEVLSLIASAQYLLLDESGMRATLAEVDKIDPNNSSAYVEVANQIVARYQFGPAESLYQTAITRAPWWNAPRNGLGVLYTHSGEEDKARQVLSAAREIDPFNLSTTNYLKVLDQMEKFKRVELEHFILLYDAQDDPIIPKYIGPYMEQAYKEVTADFKHEPKQKTLLEIFPTASSFSVRTAGMTGAETFGASFGPVITAVAPRAGQTLGKFNWARVLRHEFTHVMNMSQTEGRCPRWLTEGLAVWQEKVEYRFEFVPPVLYKAATNGELWKVRELERIFASPKKGTDGELAYMQGFWIVLHLREKYGPDSMIKLLEGYTLGKEDEAAFEYATGVPITQFESDFFAWAKARVAKWGYDEESAKHYKEMYDLGEENLKASQFEDAAIAYTRATEIQPLNPAPHRRLAGLFLRLKKPKEALPHMEALIPLELQDNRYAKRMSRIYKEAGDPVNAKKYADLSIWIDPYDPLAHELLAELYDATDPDKAADERAVAKLLKDRKATPEPAPTK